MKKFIGLIVMLVILFGIGIYIWGTPITQDELSVELDGVWKVYKYNQHSIEQEYIIFDDSKLQYYRDEVMEGEYLVEGNKLTIPDFGKEYQIQEVSDNQLVLFENDNKTYLFRINEMDEVVDKAMIINRWEVLFHNLTAPENETVTFSEAKLIDKRNNEVYMELNYTWLNNRSIYVDGIECEFEIYPLNESNIMLLEKNGNYVWELEVING